MSRTAFQSLTSAAFLLALTGTNATSASGYKFELIAESVGLRDAQYGPPSINDHGDLAFVDVTDGIVRGNSSGVTTVAAYSPLDPLPPLGSLVRTDELPLIDNNGDVLHRSRYVTDGTPRLGNGIYVNDTLLVADGYRAWNTYGGLVYYARSGPEIYVPAEEDYETLFYYQGVIGPSGTSEVTLSPAYNPATGDGAFGPLDSRANDNGVAFYETSDDVFRLVKVIPFSGPRCRPSKTFPPAPSMTWDRLPFGDFWKTAAK